MKHRFSLEKSRFDEILASIEKAASEINCPSETLTQINIAVSEIVSNIGYYSLTDPDHREIEMNIDVQADRIVIDIVDAGIPFNPLDVEAPDIAQHDRRRRGGFGIYIVKRLMDVVSYERRDDRNVLRIEKRIR